MFTDDDLKRLKVDDDIGLNGFMVDIRSDKFKALLARLEAAEACIPHVYANRERFRALEKWRKAAGK